MQRVEVLISAIQLLHHSYQGRPGATFLTFINIPPMPPFLRPSLRPAQPATHGLLAALLPSLLCLGSLLAAPLQAHAQHAHAHGRLQLDASVEERLITVRIEAPLESLVSFERAPRTDTERRRVADMAAHLQKADNWLQPDPAAQCQAGTVTLEAPVVGLGAPAAGADAGHADLDITVRFPCARAADSRFIDVGLFGTYKGVRSIEAQVASPQGQFKRTLLRGKTTRLGWGQ